MGVKPEDRMGSEAVLEDQVLLVWSNAPDEETAMRIANALVEEKLAACVHTLPQGRSVYRWEGKIHQSAEWTLMIKTRAVCYSALKARLVALHPYDVPEILACPVERGSSDYLKWVVESAQIS